MRTLPGFTLSHEGGSLVITRRGYSHAVVVIIISCVAVATLLFIIFANHQGNTASTNPAGIVLAVPLIMIICYFVVAKVGNATIIRLNNSLLTVRVGPLPVGGNKDVKVQDIDELFCEKKTNTSSDSRSNQYYTTIYYNVVVQLKTGQRVIVVFALEKYEDARYIEQLVEQHLGITHRPLAGEVCA